MGLGCLCVLLICCCGLGNGFIHANCLGDTLAIKLFFSVHVLLQKEGKWVIGLAEIIYVTYVEGIAWVLGLALFNTTSFAMQLSVHSTCIQYLIPDWLGSLWKGEGCPNPIFHKDTCH